MSEIAVTPHTVQEALDRAQAGDEFVFQSGRYTTPLTLSNKIGVVLRGRPGAVLTRGVSVEDFREEANRRSKQVQDDHEYPGLWPWMLDGQLVLRRCDQVRIVDLAFEQSWPTHIAIDDCRAIEIEGCDFKDGTFAIGAEGRRTYGVRVDRCTWVQDRVPGRIWRQIPWAAIHGAPPDDLPVDIVDDWRLFDGDFLRAKNIAGGITISHCEIRQAFNAIHCFNPASDLNFGRDFHVHNCKFIEIRDNVLEPESVAKNWWFHHNVIMNAHKWFSFELVRCQFMYLFSNLAWFTSIQGPEVGDAYRGGGVFKPNKEVKAAHGPIYVFNNSIVTRGDYIRKGVLPGLKHRNNAILCLPLANPNLSSFPNFFGDLTAPGTDTGKRFVTDWKTYEIEMLHDIVGYPGWPQGLIDAGYPIDPSSRCAHPAFVDRNSTDPEGSGLRLVAGSPCLGAAGPLEVTFAGSEFWRLEAGADIGAWQGDVLLDGPEFRGEPVV